MQRFIYKAKTRSGDKNEGKIEARSMDSAVALLRERGLVIISIKPFTESSGLDSLINFQKVGLTEVVAFTRQLSTMMNSGLALTEALSILEMQSKPAMAKIVGQVLNDIQTGNSVADAMAAHPKAFSDIYVSLIRAGEAAGALDDILVRLSENLEKQKEFRAKTRGALIYPVIVTIGMFIVMAVMMIFVIPKLAEMYENFDAQLPLPTLILITISDIFVKFWYLMIAGGFGGWYTLQKWRKTESGGLIYDRWLLKLPVFGMLRTKIVLAEVARTMSLLIGSGITLLETLEIVDSVVDNKVYQNALREISKSVRKGVPFSVAITHEEIFPPLFPNMIAIGEETGKMDEVMGKVAAYFEEEAENLIKNLTTALEPLIMVVLGIGVGFLVMSIILPIYNLTNQF